MRQFLRARGGARRARVILSARRVERRHDPTPEPVEIPKRRLWEKQPLPG